ncbi:c-type cytochrome [Gemmata sp.]|uniref:c-type cytochrome n=1 Tax=Gemmata sp. TaxID=1914242 RepID=UPI003F72210B
MTTRAALLVTALVAVPACDATRSGERQQYAASITGGDPARGRDAIGRRGCAACHTIPGVPGADANVGPPLTRVGSRVYLAGVLLNTPENMARWLRDPPAVDPRTAMPNVGATDDEVRDISAYLYTLR